MLENLEKELRKWRENRASKPQSDAPSDAQRDVPMDRRTVKVNGQDVVVVRKAKKPRSAANE